MNGHRTMAEIEAPLGVLSRFILGKYPTWHGTLNMTKLSLANVSMLSGERAWAPSSGPFGSPCLECWAAPGLVLRTWTRTEQTVHGVGIVKTQHDSPTTNRWLSMYYRGSGNEWEPGMVSFRPRVMPSLTRFRTVTTVVVLEVKDMYTHVEYTLFVCIYATMHMHINIIIHWLPKRGAMNSQRYIYVQRIRRALEYRSIMLVTTGWQGKPLQQLSTIINYGQAFSSDGWSLLSWTVIIKHLQVSSDCRPRSTSIN